MFNKINIWLIISDHISTLRDFKSDRISVADILLFLVAPIVVAFLLVFGLHFSLDTNAINVLITSLSVFSALLFNLLLLIYDIIRKEKDDHGQSSLRREFLRQIYYNISFSILTAVLCIALLLLLFIEFNYPPITDTVNLFVDFLVINFILTMLMILKRVHILLSAGIPPKASNQGGDHQ